MSLPQPAQTLGTEFSVFLRSPLWEEKTGGTLSVLSAFARLDLDPWQEAASLAGLSREAAARQLALTLGRLPVSAPDVAFDSICARSVSLLPPSADRGLMVLVRADIQPSPTPSRRQLALLAAWMVILSLIGGQLASRQLEHGGPAATGPGKDAMTLAATGRPGPRPGFSPN